MKDLTERLTSILYSKENVRKYLGAFQGIFDDLYEQIELLKIIRWIDNAEGVNLDGCGSIVNQKREGLEDLEYREKIKFRIFVNRSSGTVTDINTAVSMLTNPTEQHYLESYPMSYTVFSNGLNAPDDIGLLLKEISLGGIGQSSFVCSYGDDALFLSGTSAKSFLKVNGKRFKVNGQKLNAGAGQIVESGSYLGGISSPKLVNNIGKNLTIGGKRLRMNTSVNQTIIGSGTKMTGAYEI